MATRTAQGQRPTEMRGSGLRGGRRARIKNTTRRAGCRRRAVVFGGTADGRPVKHTAAERCGAGLAARPAHDSSRDMPHRIALLVLLIAASAAGQETGRIRVEVQTTAGDPVAGATVVVAGTTHVTDAAGVVLAPAPAGPVQVTVVREGSLPVTVPVTLAPGDERVVRVALESELTLEEEVTVVATTRTGRRIEDQPMRVEALDREEIEEKMLMTPGDIVMMLNEMGGMRVQATSPSLGAASVRIQGMRGRYTRILSDGLPLYGSQPGGLGLLQIPPMDLGQVEVVKGVASALHGAGAMGGVVNLLSRRPGDEAEREVLLNQSTRGATDGVLWLSTPLSETWGMTLVGGGHRQARADVDGDGWTDMAGYARGVVRPRFFWEDGEGRSLFFTAGATRETSQRRHRAGAGAPRRRSAISGGPRYAPAGSRRPVADAGRARRRDRSRGPRAAVARAPVRRGLRARPPRHELRRGRGAADGGAAHVGRGGRGRARRLPSRRRPPVRPRLHHARPVRAGRRRRAVVAGPVDERPARPPQRLRLVRQPPRVGPPAVGRLVDPPVGGHRVLRADGAHRGDGGGGPDPPHVDGPLRAERGRSFSVDLTRTHGPAAWTVTVFGSRIADPVHVDRETYVLRNLDRPVTNVGTELLGTFRQPPFALTASYTYVRSREHVGGVAADVAQTPRHGLGLVAMAENEDGRIGFELYYTGRQRLEANPYRDFGEPYTLMGCWLSGGSAPSGCSPTSRTSQTSDSTGGTPSCAPTAPPTDAGPSTPGRPWTAASSTAGCGCSSDCSSIGCRDRSRVHSPEGAERSVACGARPMHDGAVYCAVCQPHERKCTCNCTNGSGSTRSRARAA